MARKKQRRQPPGPPPGEKVELLGIERKAKTIYYLHGDEIYSMPMFEGGGKFERTFVARISVDMDPERWDYYVDVDGDLSRKAKDPPTSPE